ncbi:uncharacterized protein LOC126034921 isoform X4 [Accipiter gentilis]|uniref:uncharacterized protein LOC126034921 isoform X4 n=1 Tax=Astur gentilis TaxID=8957 RepID=UPI002110C4F7|nr:uncharacterized protein LOC126034921 isoform X4 [Accipiter gentilis]
MDTLVQPEEWHILPPMLLQSSHAAAVAEPPPGLSCDFSEHPWFKVSGNTDLPTRPTQRPARQNSSGSARGKPLRSRAATPSLSSSQVDNEVASSQPEQKRKSISGCFFSFPLLFLAKNLTACLKSHKQCQKVGIGSTKPLPKAPPNLHSCSHMDIKHGRRTKRSHTGDALSAVPQILGFLAVDKNFSVGAQLVMLTKTHPVSGCCKKPHPLPPRRARAQKGHEEVQRQYLGLPQKPARGMSWRPAAAQHRDRAAMRGAVIFLAFMGAVTTISIAPLQNPVWVSPGEKAILPISLQLLNPTWDFYHIKWSFLTGDRPVLIYTMERCNQTLAASGQQCQQRMEVGDFYSSRANISYNTSLVLQDTQPDDAGVYQLTVQGLDVAHTTQITLILQGTFSPLFLSGNPAHAHLNQTALLSFSLRTPCSGWDFIHITWELISSPKNRPILTYTLDGCTGKAWNWWEQSCIVSQEVDGSYRQRAGIRPNGTLALRDVRDEDAGTYLVTVRAPDGFACVGVNLSVSREMLAAEWPSILSIIQIAAAGVVLCFLALILGEHMFWHGDKLEKTPGGTCHQSQPPPGYSSG